jgi:outer membrane protein assembly factor BamB
MKMRAGVAVAAGAVLSVLWGALLPAQQPRSQIYSRPEPPPREVLDRLNLVQAWRAYVPTDGERDGLMSVQFLGTDMLVETRSGLVVLMDPETGDTRWRARVGTPYRTVRPPVANSKNVFVLNNGYLFALNRATGAVQWDYRLPGGISAQPVVDEEFILFATAEGRLASFYLPRLDLLSVTDTHGTGGTGAWTGEEPVSPLFNKERLNRPIVSPLATVAVRGTSLAEQFGPRPIRAWEAVTNLRIEFPPVITPDAVLAFSPDGSAVAYLKIPRDRSGTGEVYRFAADGRIVVSPAQFGDMVYVGSEDTNLYALSTDRGRLVWRYSAGQPVAHHPVALDQDVYVSALGAGLARLDRATGVPLWRVPRGQRVLETNVDADRFLAANSKFVYAADRSGRLLVLDRRLGHRLSGYDTHDFPFPVVNELTDRLYLASNDGQIVCLHDKEFTAPMRHRRLVEQAPTPVEQKLKTPVTDAGGKPVPLVDLLDQFRTKYNLKITVADRDFKSAGREPVGPQFVTFPKVEDKPLGDVLQLILSQVNATFRVLPDGILIVPAAAVPVPPP